MRILLGIAIVMVWIMILVVATATFGLYISNDAQVLSTAIVFAGVMAGGDG